MIYLKEPNTNRIVEFDNEQQIGAYFSDWIRLEGEELATYLLDQAKILKISEVKFKRDIFQNIPITIGNNTYKSTRDAKLLFWSKVNGAGAADYPIKWRLVDDKTPSYLTKDQANTLYEAFEEQETRGFDQESIFLNRIDEAKTLEELDAINIEYK